MNGKAPTRTEIKMRKPIVAVTADTLLAEMKPINQKMADYAPRPLIDALGRNGFLPVILPYNDYAEAEELVGTFDASSFQAARIRRRASTMKIRSGALGRRMRREISSKSTSYMHASRQENRSSASAAACRS